MLSVIIVAAGEGLRLKAAVPKPLVKIGKTPAIIYSLQAFQKHPEVSEIILVLNAKNQPAIKRLIRNYHFKKIKNIVLGGRLRQDSVYNGLKAVSPESAWVLIHDSARPFIDQQIITRVIRGARQTGAAIAAVTPKATLKSSRGNSRWVEKTLDRRKLWEIQTPQVFRKDLILRAYAKYSAALVTDDAALVEKLAQPVKLIPGSYSNIKITTGEDLLLAGLIAKRFNYAI